MRDVQQKALQAKLQLQACVYDDDLHEYDTICYSPTLPPGLHFTKYIYVIPLRRRHKLPTPPNP